MLKTVKTIVAIGGGELGELETLPIDKKIVALAKKSKPKVLFIPTASNDAEGYCDTFQKVYGDKLHCQVDFLLLTKKHSAQKELSQKILSADIIYVGGGDTEKMLQVWYQQGVNEILQQAYKKGVILSGISAGAICWFHYGVSDSVPSTINKKLFGQIKGLNLLQNNILISPHHVRENEIRTKSIQKIIQSTPNICLAIDDNAALVLQDNTYQIWRSEKNAQITKYYQQQNELKFTQLKTSGDLTELKNKK